MKNKLLKNLKTILLFIGVPAVILIAAILFVVPHTKTLDLYNGLFSTNTKKVELNDLQDYAGSNVSRSAKGLTLLSSEPENDIFHVRLKGTSPGTYNVLIASYPEGSGNVLSESFSQTVTVTKSLGLYNSEYTFNRDDFLYLAIGAIYLYLAVMLFTLHRKTRKGVFFSYKTILTLGLAIYFLLQALIVIPYTTYGFGHPDLPGRNYALVNGFSLTVIALLSALPLMIFALLMTISNLGLLRKEGGGWRNILGILLSAVLFFGIFLLAFIFVRTAPDNLAFDPKDSAIEIVRGIIASLIVYFECNLFSTLLHCQLAGHHKPEYDKDFIIILGCGIREDGTLYPLLKGRADRAVAFAREQEKATGRKAYFVPSGGQGPDECMPEGEAIKNYLLSCGIPEERILPETESVNTLQNMKFSKRIIDAADSKGNVLFSTTNYHVFRSGILASDVGMNADGMGAKTKWYFWPNALIREFIGMLARYRKLHAALITILILQAVLFGNFQWFIGLIL